VNLAKQGLYCLTNCGPKTYMLCIDESMTAIWSFVSNWAGQLAHNLWIKLVLICNSGGLCEKDENKCRRPSRMQAFPRKT
jgi:hypothetical protein